MEWKRYSYLILIGLMILSTGAMAEATFKEAEKAISLQVDLFEFDSQIQQQQAIALAKSLRCPQCQNQNLIESNSPIAKDLRLKVFTMIKDGRDDQYIIDYMTTRFGEFVLYKPQLAPNTYLLWFLPILILFAFIFMTYRSVKKNN